MRTFLSGISESQRGEIMEIEATTVWIAVRSQRGLITDAEVFRSLDSATERERHWRESLNPDYDETAVIAGELAS